MLRAGSDRRGGATPDDWTKSSCQVQGNALEVPRRPRCRCDGTPAQSCRFPCQANYLTTGWLMPIPDGATLIRAARPAYALVVDRHDLIGQRRAEPSLPTHETGFELEWIKRREYAAERVMRGNTPFPGASIDATSRASIRPRSGSRPSYPLPTESRTAQPSGSRADHAATADCADPSSCRMLPRCSTLPAENPTLARVCLTENP